VLTASFGLGFVPAFTATFAAVFAVCEVKAKEAATMHAVGVTAGVQTGRVQKPPQLRPGPAKPKPAAQPPKQKLFGQWLSLTYDKATDLDCAVTYTCKYGRNFDEVSFRETVWWSCCTAMLIHHRSATISLGESTKGTLGGACIAIKVLWLFFLGSINANMVIARGDDREYAKADWGGIYWRSAYRSQAQLENPARCQV
jgi:chitinase